MSRGLIRGWLAAVVAMFCLSGCSGAPKPQPDPDWEVTVVANGDTVDVTRDGSVALDPYPGGPVAVPAPTSTEDFVFGYRIQLLATSSMMLAEGEMGRADSLFNWPTYVEYEPPFYKVRIGDFYSKNDAETVRSNVQPDFPEAWVVQTMVRRPE